MASKNVWKWGSWCMAACTGGGLALVAGCGTFRPQSAAAPYTFIQNSAELRPYLADVYPASPKAGLTVGARISQPEGASIRFSSGTVDLHKKPFEKLDFCSGVYPFQVLTGKRPELVGAMMFYNIDDTVSLATLGMTDDKLIFSPELLEKARSGMLAKYTMQFENKNVLTYWIGNRLMPYTGGEPPTVEVDFSAITGISELKIGGDRSGTFRATLPVYQWVTAPGGGREKTPCRYNLEFACGAKRYRGFIQNLVDNEFTAFVRIPCGIPADLLQAADRGTVSRFSVTCDVSGSSRPVAEIVIGGGQ